MTKKDYEAIAASIKASWNDIEDFNNSHAQEAAVNEAVTHIVDNLAQSLSADNPKFDSDKFLEACGYMQ